MYENLRSQNVLSYDVVEKMFEDHQDKWPEAIFNEDSMFKYIDPLIEDGTGTYLAMLQGSKEEQRKWWLSNRFKYLDSKYNAGSAASDVIQLRGYAKSNITVKPYADIYASIKYGSYLQQTRANRGQEYTIVCPLDNVNDTEIYIYSASQLASIGDVSGLKVGLADFSKATRLQDVKVGDADPNYTNENLGAGKNALTFGNNTLLKTIDARNCINLGTGDQKSIDISHCSNIEEVYFDGTKIQGIQLPNGGVLRKLHLPATITNLTILNQKKLTEFVLPSYENISSLRLENNSSVIDTKTILGLIPDNTRVRIIGFYWECEDSDEIDDIIATLNKMRGLDEQGNNMDTAQVSGTIHTASLTGERLAYYHEHYPYLNVTADHTTSVITFKTWDGSSVIDTVNCIDGVPQSSAPSVPSRSQTAQYTFTAVGWNKQQDASTNDSSAMTNVIYDTTLYAAYSRTVRTYTVTWVNANGTTLETDNNVPYGTTPTYNGSTPTYDGQTAIGWTPDVSSVTGNITYTALYKPKYTVRFYNGTTLLETKSVIEGNTVSYTGTTPTNSEGTTFLGWSNSKDSHTADAVLTNITANHDFYAAFESAVEVVEITDTWDTIIVNIDNGTYKTKYKVGNYKSIDLGTEGTHDAQIIGIDTDANRSGSTVPLTFAFVDLLATKHRMNPSKTAGTEGTGTLGGWEKTEMRTYLNDTILPLFPSNIRERINAVQKITNSYDVNESKFQETTYDRLWLLSYREVFGSTSYEQSGPMYTSLFKDNASRIKNYNGSADGWWLRSAISAASFGDVSSGGNADNNNANSSRGVCPGFSLGYESETIADDWSAIAASAANGTYKTKYSIGDTKSIDLGTEGTHLMQLVAFDTDDKADGTGKAPMTWIMKDLLPTQHRMNPTKVDGTEGTGTLGGYDKTEMKSYLTNTILPLVPSDVRNNIVPVTKHQKAYDASGTAFQESTTETLWIPGHKEIFNSTSYDTDGPAYSDVFNDSASRIKKRNGSFYYWWLRSANSTAGFRSVDSDGSYSSIGASGAGGVCPGFCF